MRALIADDDRLSAAMVQSALAGSGLEIVTAQDGAHAWEILRADDAITLAIVDWEMPGLTGPELCRRLRQDESRAHLYVLLLTMRDSRADLIAGLEAGADDYLTKPFDLGELRARVQVGLRVLGLQRRLAERVRELETAASKITRLHGLLPICSYCKQVRSDQNYWQQVEDYLAQHSDLQFTHGICPPCFEAALREIEKT